MRKTFLAMQMSEHNVNPEWLKNKKTEQIRKLYEESQAKLREEAQMIQEDLLNSQLNSLRNVFEWQFENLSAQKKEGEQAESQDQSGAFLDFMLNGLNQIHQRNKIAENSSGQLVTKMLIKALS